MRIPPKIQFSLMSIKTFKEYAKKCIAFGIREYELTPILEPVLDPCLIDKVKFLDQYGVSMLFYNNIFSYEKIGEILEYERVEIRIKDDCNETLKDRRRKGICKFAIENNCIFSNGDITICSWFDIDWFNIDKIIIGNINKQSLEEIYDSKSKYEYLLQQQLEGKYTSICEYCTMWKNKNFKSWLFREKGYKNYVLDK